MSLAASVSNAEVAASQGEEASDKGKGMTVKEFLAKLKENKCPFCEKALTYYDGAIGYSAMRCEACGVYCDHAGTHVEAED